MPNTAKFLDYDGLVQYTGKVKKAINDGDAAVLSTIRAEEVTDIQGTTTAPTYANDLNATATQRSANFTNGGSSDTFPYYDTTYGDASTTKDGLMTHEDKVKLNGIAAGAEVNVQSDWAQDTTTADDYIKNKPTFASINGSEVTDGTAWLLVETSTLAGSTGAGMVGYDKSSTINTVDAALDDIYATIGGSGGSGTLTGRVTALEGAVEDLQEGSNLVEGANITITPDTTNHTVTIAAADEKVSHTADTTSDGLIPVLFAGNSYNSSPSEVRYNSNLSYNPSGANLRLTNVTNSAYYTTINGEAIELKGANNSRVILSVDGFTGNAATATKATNDGNNNNIVNTYATKAELAAMKSGQFKVATSAEATAIAQGDASSLELGYIYLVEDTGASSPNIYDEYIKVAKGTTPETYAVEKIGTTDAGVDVVSLTTAEINTIWSTTAAAS